MNARQKLPHCVGFTESPAAGLRRCGLCCGISVGCEGIGGQILVEPFAAGAIMWSGGRTPSPSSWAGAQRCDAMPRRMGMDGLRVLVEQPPAATPFACTHRAWLGIRTDMSACSAAVSRREKLKEGGA